CLYKLCKKESLWLSQSKQNLGALVPAFAIKDSLCSFNISSNFLTKFLFRYEIYNNIDLVKKIF
ncbi:hypothetical protein, partial [Actinotignum timonense]|nr:hypothetical protein [Actinotignum timonense]